MPSIQPPDREPRASSGGVELSIVMPCLDEAATVATCVEKALGFLERAGIAGEVIVADNGSTDGSQAIARKLGARVVDVSDPGYGSALDGGIRASRGTYVVIGDADDSYDFSDLSGFVEKLRAGCDFVMGNRFRGGIRPGAMPWLHRYLGNPLLSAVGRLFFRAPVRDFHCGLRAFSRTAYERIDPQTTGMEFASEMVIKAQMAGLRIAEVPTSLHPDGRSRAPHLRTWRDGWRHLRFMLLFSPRWLFLFPGMLLLAGGLVVSLLLIAAPRALGGAVLDINTLLVSGIVCIIGYQLIVFALFTKVFTVTEGFQPMPGYLEGLLRHFRLEHGIVVAAVMILSGAGILAAALWKWREADFGELNPRETMRWMIPGSVILALGVQTLFSSFFFSILGLRRRRRD